VSVITFAFIELQSSILTIVANLGRHITLFLLGLFASASSRFCNSINSSLGMSPHVDTINIISCHPHSLLQISKAMHTNPAATKYKGLPSAKPMNKNNSNNKPYKIIEHTSLI
jgi:hypothetical protein